MEFVVCGEEWRAGFSRGPTAMKQRELYQWRPGTWAEDSPWQITPQHFADSGRHCGQLPVPEATRGEYKGGLLRNLSCRCSISCWSLVALLRRLIRRSPPCSKCTSWGCWENIQSSCVLTSNHTGLLLQHRQPKTDPQGSPPCLCPFNCTFWPSLMWITTLQTQE